jgi:urate oxidase
MASKLGAARYGKDNVRVYKVHRDQKTGVQTVVEMPVCCLLEGDIDTSYVVLFWYDAFLSLC